VDLSTFYAVVSATSFTLVGLWWTVVERRPDWLADQQMRRLVGGVYISFLLPGLMSLFAQVDPSEPLIWRFTFVIASAIGAYSTFKLIQVDRKIDFPGPVRRFRWPKPCTRPSCRRAGPKRRHATSRETGSAMGRSGSDRPRRSQS